MDYSWDIVGICLWSKPAACEVEMFCIGRCNIISLEIKKNYFKEENVECGVRFDDLLRLFTHHREGASTSPLATLSTDKQKGWKG